MLKLKYRYAVLINNIINQNRNYRYGVITMNNKFVNWAYKKGYVLIISATQQEWTDKGVLWFRKISNDLFNFKKN